MQITDILHAVDAHAEGELTRVVVGGLPQVGGATMGEKRQTLMKDDALRRYLLGEPHGHICMHAVCVYPPADPAADAGIVIMEATDYPAMSGSNLICAATVLLETGMVQMTEPVSRFVIETPAGLVPVEAQCEGGRCRRVKFENVPAFVMALDVGLDVPDVGPVTADIVWGGAFFAMVDAESLGLQVTPQHARELSRLGQQITAAAADQVPVVHPERPDLHTVTFTNFTDRPRSGGHGRNTNVISPGRLDRSACGTGTSARLAALFERGRISVGEDFVNESIISTTFTGRIEGTVEVSGVPAIRPSISGRAWITGLHQLGRDPDDPLGRGFGLGDTWLGAEEAWGHLSTLAPA